MGASAGTALGFTRPGIEARLEEVLTAYKADIPLGMIREENDFRISVAGAQEKTALLARIMAFLMGSSEALRDRYDFMKFQVFQCTTIMTANDWILPWFILVRIMYIMLNHV